MTTERRKNLPGPAPRPEPLILDAARDARHDYLARWPRHKAWRLYLWMKYLRPLLLVAAWCGFLFLLWRHLPQLPLRPPPTGLLLGFGMFLPVVAAALLRSRRRMGRGPNQAPPPPRIDAFTPLSIEQLEQARASRRLIVQHDADGLLAATDAAVRHAPATHITSTIA